MFHLQTKCFILKETTPALWDPSEGGGVESRSVSNEGVVCDGAGACVGSLTPVLFTLRQVADGRRIDDLTSDCPSASDR